MKQRQKREMEGDERIAGIEVRVIIHARPESSASTPKLWWEVDEGTAPSAFLSRPRKLVCLFVACVVQRASGGMVRPT